MAVFQAYFPFDVSYFLWIKFYIDFPTFFQCLPLDFDECQQATHNCHAQASCVNKEGSFECKCKDGYQGDEITNCGKYILFMVVVGQDRGMGRGLLTPLFSVRFMQCFARLLLEIYFSHCWTSGRFIMIAELRRHDVKATVWVLCVRRVNFWY